MNANSARDGSADAKRIIRQPREKAQNRPCGGRKSPVYRNDRMLVQILRDPLTGVFQITFLSGPKLKKIRIPALTQKCIFYGVKKFSG